MRTSCCAIKVYFVKRPIIWERYAFLIHLQPSPYEFTVSNSFHYPFKSFSESFQIQRNPNSRITFDSLVSFRIFLDFSESSTIKMAEPRKLQSDKAESIKYRHTKNFSNVRKSLYITLKLYVLFAPCSLPRECRCFYFQHQPSEDFHFQR